jgi:hypothetical protein
MMKPTRIRAKDPREGMKGGRIKVICNMKSDKLPWCQCETASLKGVSKKPEILRRYSSTNYKSIPFNFFLPTPPNSHKRPAPIGLFVGLFD